MSDILFHKLQVLEQASKTYKLLCDDEFAIYDKVSVARRAVIDSWFENFRLALDIFKEAVKQQHYLLQFFSFTKVKFVIYLYVQLLHCSSLYHRLRTEPQGSAREA